MTILPYAGFSISMTATSASGSGLTPRLMFAFRLVSESFDVVLSPHPAVRTISMTPKHKTEYRSQESEEKKIRRKAVAAFSSDFCILSPDSCFFKIACDYRAGL